MASKRKKEMAIVYLLFLLCFSPVFIVFARGNWNTVVDSPYLNGLITACGVFVAFICAATITKAKDLDYLDILFARTSLLAFVLAVGKLTIQLETGYPATLTEVGIISSSINLCALATWSILHTMLRKSRANHA